MVDYKELENEIDKSDISDENKLYLKKLVWLRIDEYELEIMLENKFV